MPTYNTTPKATDTKLTRLRKWLQRRQNLPGAASRNNIKSGDTVRATLVKILRTYNGG